MFHPHELSVWTLLHMSLPKKILEVEGTAGNRISPSSALTSWCQMTLGSVVLVYTATKWVCECFQQYSCSDLCNFAVLRSVKELLKCQDNLMPVFCWPFLFVCFFFLLSACLCCLFAFQLDGFVLVFVCFSRLICKCLWILDQLSVLYT